MMWNGFLHVPYTDHLLLSFVVSQMQGSCVHYDNDGNHAVGLKVTSDFLQGCIQAFLDSPGVVY